MVPDPNEIQWDLEIAKWCESARALLKSEGVNIEGLKMWQCVQIMSGIQTHPDGRKIEELTRKQKRSWARWWLQKWFKGEFDLGEPGE